LSQSLASRLAMKRSTSSRLPLTPANYLVARIVGMPGLTAGSRVHG
jgi:hypothetical protein